jgi:hypothetical protein
MIVESTPSWDRKADPNKKRIAWIITESITVDVKSGANAEKITNDE